MFKDIIATLNRLAGSQDPYNKGNLVGRNPNTDATGSYNVQVPSGQSIDDVKARVERQRAVLSGSPVQQIPQQAIPQAAQVQVKEVNNNPRNPNWENWKKANPGKFAEILSGSQIASNETGVPYGLLMDIAGAETSGGQNMNQLSGGPGKGWFQFEGDTINDLGQNIDPNSATESARLAARLIANKQLSRWGTPGSKWGTLDNSNNSNGALTDFYSPEELNQYLSDKWAF